MEEAARSRSSSRSQLPAKLDSKDTNRIRMPESQTDLIDAASRLRATFESVIWCEMSFGVVPVRCVVCTHPGEATSSLWRGTPSTQSRQI